MKIKPRSASATAALLLTKVRRLARREAATRFEFGDGVIALHDRHGLSFRRLARELGHAEGRLHAIYATALAFPPDRRDPRASFTLHEHARACAVRFDLCPAKALAELRRAGISQRRDAVAHFRRLAAAETPPETDAGDAFAGQCLHADCREVIASLPAGQVDLLVFDPPYATHTWGCGRLRRSQRQPDGDTRDESDAASAEEAFLLVRDVLRLGPSVLRPGGVMLLWQSGRPVDARVLIEAHDAGWDTTHELIWDKGRAGRGGWDGPYRLATERCFVLCRAGDLPGRHDGRAAAANVLRHPALRARPGGAGDDHHVFAKPPALCEELVARHCPRGGVVLDACGCGGNFSIAAARLGRRWCYVESHAGNFAWGSRRVQRAVGQLQPASMAASNSPPRRMR